VKLVRERVRQVFTEANQSQLTGEELRALVDEELTRLEK